MKFVAIMPALIKGQILRITYRRIRPVGLTGRIRLYVISPIITDD